MAESIKLKNDRYWDSKGVYDSTKGASQEDVNKTIIASHVGQVIMTTTLDTEAKVIAVYGGSSWSKIEGRFLLGASSSYQVNSTGGSADLVVPYHNHTFTGSAVTSGTQSANHTHTVNGGAHTHSVSAKSGAILFTKGGTVASASAGVTAPTDWGNGAQANSEGGHTHTVGNNSANHTHSVTAAGTVGYAGTSGNVTGANMPPYKAVYIWERTS